MSKLYALLDELQISYEKFEHPPVFTIEECEILKSLKMPGIEAKSLFLRNDKGSEHYLVVLAGHKRLNLKELGLSLGTKFSFASPDRLLKYLGVTPGSVSPFALMNDMEKTVKVCLDTEVFAEEKVQFHPLVNTATLVLNAKDLLRFIEATGHSYQLMDLA
ncbi:prolyl-tRNA synthetase associated domain-containing protein [Candidatus Peregrinibacteria bacterium]|nr:MAG: prolyl-tRNA synthetase associated domain-containing protein [Candidatus Peregrinibacteria bacterium]